MHHSWISSLGHVITVTFLETEYAAINSMLDEINSCLDDLEERNDALNGKLHELLESNRQARQEFQAQLDKKEMEEQKQPPSEGWWPSGRLCLALTHSTGINLL